MSQLLNQFLERSARLRPETPALRHKDATLSYAEGAVKLPAGSLIEGDQVPKRASNQAT